MLHFLVAQAAITGSIAICLIESAGSANVLCHIAFTPCSVADLTAAFIIISLFPPVNSKVLIFP